ncbi:hypothetical protein LguiB_029523 [Lonicera macranthoides]
MAFTVTLYHCILVIWCNSRQQPDPQRQETGPQGSRLENSTTAVELIPVHKYRKGTGLEREESVCPVCLSEFEEGEDLRTLPECMHIFHVQCIDMWLYSHLNCPMCRTDARVSNSDSNGPALREGSRLQQDLVV